MANTIVKNSLGYDSGLFVYQDKTMFNYSVDTILLGNFLSVGSKIQNLLEVGTNNGALSIFIAARKTSLKIDAIEIQASACILAEKNFALNHMSDQIKLINNDFKVYATLNKDILKYDSIVSNPPFYQIKNFKKPKVSKEKYEATHEVFLTLEELIKYSTYLLKIKGYLTIVIPTERLVDCFSLLRQYDFEAKRVQFIHSRTDAKSNLVLVEARYKVGWGTSFLPNIYLHTADKSNKTYQDSVKKLYKPVKERKTNT